MRFGQAIGVIAWESLDDFPDARKIVKNATTTWPMFISIVFLPQCMMALSLVGTPWLCAGVDAREFFSDLQLFSFTGVMERVGVGFGEGKWGGGGEGGGGS